MIKPLTIGECDEQLDRVREQYLRAEQHLEFGVAFDKWTELQRLLDMRLRMPLPRQSPENGDQPCAPTSVAGPSTSSAS